MVSWHTPLESPGSSVRASQVVSGRAMGFSGILSIFNRFRSITILCRNSQFLFRFATPEKSIIQSVVLLLYTVHRLRPNMPHLLDLPVELVGSIVDQVVTSHFRYPSRPCRDTHKVLELRFVCRMFADEVPRSICRIITLFNLDLFRFLRMPSSFRAPATHPVHAQKSKVLAAALYNSCLADRSRPSHKHSLPPRLRNCVLIAQNYIRDSSTDTQQRRYILKKLCETSARALTQIKDPYRLWSLGWIPTVEDALCVAASFADSALLAALLEIVAAGDPALTVRTTRREIHDFLALARKRRNAGFAQLNECEDREQQEEVEEENQRTADQEDAQASGSSCPHYTNSHLYLQPLIEQHAKIQSTDKETGWRKTGIGEYRAGVSGGRDVNGEPVLSKVRHEPNSSVISNVFGEPIMCAVQHSNVEALRWMLSSKCVLRTRSSAWRTGTAVAYAIQVGNVDVISLLLERWLSVPKMGLRKNLKARGFIYTAVFAGKADVVAAVISAVSSLRFPLEALPVKDADFKAEAKDVAFFAAVESQKLALVEWLLGLGVNVDLRVNQGKTALGFAIQERFLDIEILLRRYGAVDAGEPMRSPSPTKKTRSWWRCRR